MSTDDNHAMRWRELYVSKDEGQSFGCGFDEARPKVVRMSRAVHCEIQAHVESDLSSECAGLLFGHWNQEILETLITASQRATLARSSLTHFTMHPETWLSVWP